MNFAEDHLIDLLNRADDDDFCEDHAADSSLDRVLDIILSVGKPVFSRMETKSDLTQSSDDLHSRLYPDTQHFRYLTSHGQPTLVPIADDEAYALPDAPPDADEQSDFEVDHRFPVYSSREVRVLDAFLDSGTVSRVLVHGQEMLCKAHPTGILHSSVEREVTILQKIEKDLFGTRPRRTGRPHARFRVPRLRGFVKHPESSVLLGLLREWIPSASPDSRLGDLDIKTISRARREKWATQICETVDRLHDIGVVWGDGKPNNIVIDDQDNVWLIDFAGGWTNGWVDEELAETVQGDDQAVQRILHFLDVHVGQR